MKVPIHQWPLLVEGSLLPYPQGSWLASAVAYQRMMAVLLGLANARRAFLPPGHAEDCFDGWLATAADVPILDIAPDGQRFWQGVNCSQGFTIFDETPEQLKMHLDGCY